MTLPEFLSWRAFYDLYPFDDFNRFHRPAALVANSMNGRSIPEALAWLQAEPQAAPAPGERTYTAVESSLMRAFGRVVVQKKPAAKAKKG
jgi:hypothetical protein